MCAKEDKLLAQAMENVGALVRELDFLVSGSRFGSWEYRLPELLSGQVASALFRTLSVPLGEIKFIWRTCNSQAAS
jgi:hypothetical protein